MFCPEGYVTLYKMIIKADTFAFEWWVSRGRALQEAEFENQRQKFLNEHGTLENMMPLELDEYTSAIAYTHWTRHRLARFHADKFFICSNEGKLLRIGSVIFDAAASYALPFPEQLDAQHELIDFLSESFFHLDTHTGTVKSCTNKIHILNYNLLPVMEILSPFSGWSICWKPKVYDNWPEELRDLLAEQEKTMIQPYRPRIADESRAATQIVAMFDKDSEITKDTCRAGIIPHLGTLAFGRAWNKAKEQRPALGLGGRPKAKPET